ncbi:hypothetical protein TSUD_22940 [Trifolium subterraneum]|uniref:HVA22-like protein n=1 Tax=Trifolium subterraneum TaxID=3900 RepID=A0A2Z6N5H3_TRISU|nr:hypothetical protein TSUD_22940 [Trifolium subterraneum]
MLGDFINRCLILLLGYAYPGFECYKTVEKNRVDIEELRFWCKYWTIVALFTVLEKLPMYGEVKLVFFVYMWYPKTRGTSFIYETILRPYISKHENDIDRTIQEWKARGWDYVIFYWQYVAQFGHTAFLQALQQLASQSSKFSSKPTTNPVNSPRVGKKSEEQGQEKPTVQSSFMKQNSSLSKSKKWAESPPSSPSTIHRRRPETPKSQSEYVEDEVSTDDGQDEANVSVSDRINRARARLRKLDSESPRSPKTPQHRQQ